MRVNVYSEEMTDRVEIISKEIDGRKFTGLRLYLELPATVNGQQYQGPFMHRPGDDDSSAVTFWGKRDLRAVLRKMLAMLDEHYDGKPQEQPHESAPAALGWNAVEFSPPGPIVLNIKQRADVLRTLHNADRRRRFIEQHMHVTSDGRDCECGYCVDARDELAK